MVDIRTITPGMKIRVESVHKLMCAEHYDIDPGNEGILRHADKEYVVHSITKDPDGSGELVVKIWQENGVEYYFYCDEVVGVTNIDRQIASFSEEELYNLLKT